MNCVMGALDKIHQLIQIKAVGFTLFWSILCFCHRTSPVLAGLTPGPRSQSEANPDFGQSLNLDFNNKVR